MLTNSCMKSVQYTKSNWAAHQQHYWNYKIDSPDINWKRLPAIELKSVKQGSRLLGLPKSLIEQAETHVVVGLLGGLFLLLFHGGWSRSCAPGASRNRSCSDCELAGVLHWKGNIQYKGFWKDGKRAAFFVALRFRKQTFKYSLTFSACGKEYSVATATASTFLYALMNMWGAAARVG